MRYCILRSSTCRVGEAVTATSAAAYAAAIQYRTRFRVLSIAVRPCIIRRFSMTSTSPFD